MCLNVFFKCFQVPAPVVCLIVQLSLQLASRGTHGPPVASRKFLGSFRRFPEIPVRTNKFPVGIQGTFDTPCGGEV